jgi:hypothetical protein
MRTLRQLSEELNEYNATLKRIDAAQRNARTLGSYGEVARLQRERMSVESDYGAAYEEYCEVRPKIVKYKRVYKIPVDRTPYHGRRSASDVA